MATPLTIPRVLFDQGNRQGEDASGVEVGSRITVDSRDSPLIGRSEHRRGDGVAKASLASREGLKTAGGGEVRIESRKTKLDSDKVESVVASNLFRIRSKR